MSAKQLIESVISEHVNVIQSLDTSIIEDMVEMVVDCYTTQAKLILFGNGGSASDAQHITAEFVGRFVKERRPLPAISLGENTSSLTAIGNDYGYDMVFRRQLEGLAMRGDVILAFSTSGNSPNVVKALEYAKEQELRTIGFMGKDGGVMKDIVDIGLVVPSNVTARIQEAHILIGHLICQLVDDRL
jgi:D-sedoheptulose 7-phosphate isomerase